MVQFKAKALLVARAAGARWPALASGCSGAGGAGEQSSEATDQGRIDLRRTFERGGDCGPKQSDSMGATLGRLEMPMRSSLITRPTRCFMCQGSLPYGE